MEVTAATASDWEPVGSVEIVPAPDPDPWSAAWGGSAQQDGRMKKGKKGKKKKKQLDDNIVRPPPTPPPAELVGDFDNICDAKDTPEDAPLCEGFNGVPEPAEESFQEAPIEELAEQQAVEEWATDEQPVEEPTAEAPVGEWTTDEQPVEEPTAETEPTNEDVAEPNISDAWGEPVAEVDDHPWAVETVAAAVEAAAEPPAEPTLPSLMAVYSKAQIKKRIQKERERQKEEAAARAAHEAEGGVPEPAGPTPKEDTSGEPSSWTGLTKSQMKKMRLAERKRREELEAAACKGEEGGPVPPVIQQSEKSKGKRKVSIFSDEANEEPACEPTPEEALEAEIPSYSEEPPRTPSPPPNPAPIITLVQSGDLLLDVSYGESRVQYEVASQVLWSVSPVFRQMFGPDSPFKEATTLREVAHTKRNKATISLPDDDPSALLLVLKALHHRYSDLPTSITFEELVAVAVVCDKYEVAGALKYVAKEWSDPLWTVDVGYEDWVLVAWVFGYEEKFTQITKELILRSEWSPGVGLTFGKEEDWIRMFSDFLPQAVSGTLTSEREKIVTFIRAQRDSMKWSLLRGKNSCSYYNSHTKSQCEAMQLGHFVKTVDTLGLERDSWWNRSLRSTVQELAKVEPLQFLNYGGHDQCPWVPGFQVAVRQLTDNVRGLTFAQFPSRKRI